MSSCYMDFNYVGMFILTIGRETASKLSRITLVRLQITSGVYRTEHAQAIRTEFIGEFAHIEHVQVGKTNSSMKFVGIA